ncbi:G-protein coupled receptor GRL101-like [Antedon mediterranea]|uniref:G-protein coupled receptor GRL101-like n=1 Tax=Antedon mediterranea TaxID=105859 RepID=UPI003AF667C4
MVSSIEQCHSPIDKYAWCYCASITKFPSCYCDALDDFSSCDDLLKKEILRVLMFLIGVSSLIGNLFVILSRIYKRDNSVQTILIINLAVSDMLMAVYLIIIASADIHYRGRYAQVARDWKNSFLCSFAGAISTLSSECSVFLLMLMSINRALNIFYPFKDRGLSRKQCRAIVVIAWLVWVVISFLPVVNKFTSFINISYFGKNYYGQQSVCLALPMTRSRWPGWEYAIAIFIAFNSFGFIVIAVSYVLIFMSIKRTASAANRRRGREEDIKIAIKIGFIVFTDFCCWFPIILMAIGSEIGWWRLSPEIYIWSATFIMPINSSINPYLYTIVFWYCCSSKNTKPPVRAHPEVIPLQDMTHRNSTDK